MQHGEIHAEQLVYPRGRDPEGLAIWAHIHAPWIGGTLIDAVKQHGRIDALGGEVDNR